MLKQFWEVKHLWGMPPKNSGGLTKFPGGHKVIHRTAQTAFVRVVTPRSFASIPIRVLRLFYESGKADRDVFDKRNVGIHLHEKLQGSHWAVLKTNIPYLFD